MFHLRLRAVVAAAVASTLGAATSLAQTPIAVQSLATTNGRSDWVTIAVPPSEIPSGYVGGSLQTLGWPAYVGRTLGAHTTLVHVLTDGLAPSTLVNDTIDFDYNGTLPAFSAHPWATDDQLVPWLELSWTDANGDSQTFSFITTPTTVSKAVIHQDSSERITRYQARIPSTPFFTRAYLYQYRDSPVAHWDVQLVHSDPNTDVLEWDIDGLILETVTPHRIDLASALGASATTTVPGRYAATLLGPCTIGDGSRPTWTGVSVGQPSYTSGGGWSNPSHPDYPDIQSTLAALDGALVGCADVGVWSGKWLALRTTPAVPSNTALPGPPSSGGYWDNRPLGIVPDPGSTGGQAGFGATKGGDVVSTGDPVPLASYTYRLTEHLRPSAYYESNMDLVMKASHANWATWSGRTWYDPGSGWTDTLGKTLAVGHSQARPDTQGWKAADEQHYGHLELAAYYALTGRKFAEMLIREQTQVWLAQRPFHEVDESTSRGLGRTWLDMSAFYWLTLDSAIPAEILWSHANQVGNWQSAISGPVKCYSRMNVNLGTGTVEAGSTWQLGLMMHGLEAAYGITGDFGIAVTALDNLAALIEAGWWVDNSAIPASHNMVDYWLFAGGAVPTPAYYGSNGNVPGYTASTGWFYQWAARATTLGSLLLTGTLQAEAAGAVAQRYSGQPATWDDAQWR